MARIDNLENFLTDVATAIKEKKGDDTPIPATNFDTEITNLPSGGGKYAPRVISFQNYSGTELEEELSNLDTSNIVTMEKMFYQCKSITTLNLSNIDTSKVTTMMDMFKYCGKLSSLDLSSFDTKNVTNMSGMFEHCDYLTELNISNLDTSKVTTMMNMFYSCYYLPTLDVSSFDTKNVTTMTQMFNGCRKLTSLNFSNFDTSNVTGFSSMFSNCYILRDLNIANFNFEKCKAITSIFDACNKLENLDFGINLGKSYTQKTTNYGSYKLDLSPCKLLTHDSLMSVINNLYDLNLTYDVANGGTLYTQQLILGSTNLAKLTADEIAIATNKGWTVS